MQVNECSLLIGPTSRLLGSAPFRARSFPTLPLALLWAAAVCGRPSPEPFAATGLGAASTVKGAQAKDDPPDAVPPCRADGAKPWRFVILGLLVLSPVLPATVKQRSKVNYNIRACSD